MTFRILFTGWRDMQEIQPLIQALDEVSGLIPPLQPFVAIHGAARGLDALVDEWAGRFGHQVERYPADWKNRGWKAGPERNDRMVKLGADICLAFPGPGSKGTWDCIRRAADHGIPVRIYPVKS